MEKITDSFAHRAAEWDNPDKIKMTQKFVEELLNHITPNKNWKALEVGAGTGLVGLQLESQLDQIVFEDTSEAMLGVLQQKLSPDSKAVTFLGEITDYKSCDIDLVFSCMAFHHIPDTEGTLAHLYSICKPGAYLAIGDITEEDGSFHNFEPMPHNGFNTDKLKALFVNAGFQVVHCGVFNTLKRKGADEQIRDFDQFILIAKK